MNKRHYEHTLPNIRGSLSNTYGDLPDWIPEPHKGHIRSWIYPPKRMTAYVRPHGKML